jgi:hypothetical protein
MWSECLRRIDECEGLRTGSRCAQQHFQRAFQNRYRLSSVSSENFSSQEIVMASSRKTPARKMLGRSRFVFATAPAIVALLSAGYALASQGPGGGPGTASSFTQLAMAIIVYGTAALVVGAGLIGAARRH